MKHRAICPACGHKFSRLWFFRVVPECRHACPSCGVRIKSESLSEWLSDALFALPVVTTFFLWRFYSVSAWWILVSAVVMLIIGIFAFPYLTKFEVRQLERKHDA
jgi:CXXC-20-CXXC protein